MGSRQSITRVYIPYYDWEDWKNGMWSKVDQETESVMLKKAIEFTGDHVAYGSAMERVIKAWPKTMLNSLTNTGINRRAFLGHCAVMLELQIPEYIVRMAWKELTNEQQVLADAQAQKHIDNYERENRELHKNMGG
jgi:hypothetical protein